MNDILKIPTLSRYPIDEHDGYHKRCSAICNKYADLINDQEAIDNYNKKVDQESFIYKWIRREKYTEKKAEADHLRDDTYTGFSINVKAGTRNFDENIRNAAIQIDNFLGNYGNVIHLGYDAETTAIDSIVTRLQSDEYIQYIRLLGLEPWLIRLNELNTQFKQYVEDAALEEINKPDISPKESRRQTDEALHKIINRINALAILNGYDNYMPFAKEFNELVNHYNELVHEHYGRTHVQIDITNAYIAPIPSQSFTGKHVFVIPEVRLTKTTDDGIAHSVELVFTQDFDVSYKNNINKGTATLIIKGINKYKGELVTTFDIN